MQKRVTFYTLNEQNKFEFCSKLCIQQWRKLSTQKPPMIWILADSIDTLSVLDNLLWHQDKDSFIPHQTIKESYLTEEVRAPICLTLATPLTTWQGILINFNAFPLTHFENTHIIEIIAHDAKEKKLARERYKHYQKHQFIIQHYSINPTNHAKHATVD